MEKNEGFLCPKAHLLDIAQQDQAVHSAPSKPGGVNKGLMLTWKAFVGRVRQGKRELTGEKCLGICSD